MNNENLIDLLIVNAYTLYSNELLNHFHYFTNFQKGDLVMEISSMFVKSYNKNRIGYLRKKISDSEATIETLDGREFHWENAQFIKIPTELFELKRN